MATMTISVKFGGDHSDKYGKLESGHFTTNLPLEYFPKLTARDIINEQIMPQIFTTILMTASGFDRGSGGWSFNVASPRSDIKQLIESFEVGDEWIVEIDVEAPDDFGAYNAF